MALWDWSMSILGYQRHQRSASAVVGISHMSAHGALRFIEALGLHTGWICADGLAAQLEGLPIGTPQWAAIAELFVEQKVVNTEGVLSGSIRFMAAVPADGSPPTDRSLIQWAEELGRVWIEIIDNEICYIGGLNAAQQDRLLMCYAAQRPLTTDYRSGEFDPTLAQVLRGGLFDHGWSRNCGLIIDQRKPLVQLWGGIHRRSPLDQGHAPLPGEVQHGIHLTLAGKTWNGSTIDAPCPLDDDTGRLYGRNPVR